jgi:hypothetical protein
VTLRSAEAGSEDRELSSPFIPAARRSLTAPSLHSESFGSDGQQGGRGEFGVDR